MSKSIKIQKKMGWCAIMKCPKCGGENCTVINEVHTKGVSGLKLCLCGLLGLCGAGKSKNVQYWVCQSCGNKFKAK